MWKGRGKRRNRRSRRRREEEREEEEEEEKEESPGSHCGWGWVGRELVHSPTLSSPSFPSSPSDALLLTPFPSTPQHSAVWLLFQSLDCLCHCKDTEDARKGGGFLVTEPGTSPSGPSSSGSSGETLPHGSPPLPGLLWFLPPGTLWLIYLYRPE